jgi:hypothetical protein
MVDSNITINHIQRSPFGSAKYVVQCYLFITLDIWMFTDFFIYLLISKSSLPSSRTCFGIPHAKYTTCPVGC